MIKANETKNNLVRKPFRELAQKYLHKGSLVYIEGRLRTRNWEDKDTIRRYSTEVVGDNLVMLDKRKDNGDSDSDSGDSSGGYSDHDISYKSDNDRDNDNLPF